jgi:hypothetical protein
MVNHILPSGIEKALETREGDEPSVIEKATESRLEVKPTFG